MIFVQITQKTEIFTKQIPTSSLLDSIKEWIHKATDYTTS